MTDHKAVIGPNLSGPNLTPYPVSLFDRVVHAVAAAYDISPSDVLSRRKYGEVANARHTIAYILHTYHGWNISRIARHLCKDHTTVAYSLRKAPDYIETEAAFATAVNIALHMLKSSG